MLKCENWARFIDFTYLKKPINKKEILNFLKLAQQYKARGICSWPWVFWKRRDKFIKNELERARKAGILFIGVIDFPNGRGGVKAKKRQALQAKNLAFDEVDMVMNKEAFNEGNYEKVKKEILAVTKFFPQKTKLIIESGAIKKEDFGKILKIGAETKVGFIKTSTGFKFNIDFRRKLNHVKILKKIIKRNNYPLKIKMSGGLKTLKELKQAKRAGADIFGISYEKAAEILKIPGRPVCWQAGSKHGKLPLAE